MKQAPDSKQAQTRTLPTTESVTHRATEAAEKATIEALVELSSREESAEAEQAKTVPTYAQKTRATFDFSLERDLAGLGSDQDQDPQELMQKMAVYAKKLQENEEELKRVRQEEAMAGYAERKHECLGSFLGRDEAALESGQTQDTKHKSGEVVLEHLLRKPNLKEQYSEIMSVLNPQILRDTVSNEFSEIQQKVDQYCLMYHKEHAWDYFRMKGNNGKPTFTMTDGTRLGMDELEALISVKREEV